MVMIPGLVVGLVSVIVLVYFFNRKIAGIEVLAPILLSVFIGTLVKFTVEWNETKDTEFWGTWVVKATHQEDWTEWEEVDDYCDKKGRDGKTERVKCGSHTEYRYHPDEYHVTFASGDMKTVDADEYHRLEHLYGKLYHNRSEGHFHDYHRAKSRSGSGYFHATVWPGTNETFQAATLEKTYVNKVQAAKQSLFHFQKIRKEDKAHFGIYDYPPIKNHYHQDAILAPEGVLNGSANDKLVEWNAKLGPTKQVKMFVFVYRNQPIEAAFIQQSYLQGGNKNEFILCIGIDDQNDIQWAYPITWTENEALKIKIRDYAASQNKLYLDMIVDHMIPAIQEEFQRKHFKDFDYLQVETPLWGQFVSFFVCLIANIALCYWLVNNDFDHGDSLLEKLGRGRIKIGKSIIL